MFLGLIKYYISDRRGFEQVALALHDGVPLLWACRQDCSAFFRLETVDHSFRKCSPLQGNLFNLRIDIEAIVLIASKKYRESFIRESFISVHRAIINRFGWIIKGHVFWRDPNSSIRYGWAAPVYPQKACQYIDVIGKYTDIVIFRIEV